MTDTLRDGLRRTIAGAAALGAALVLKIWFVRRRQARDGVEHASRLSADIASVADTIEADLLKLRGTPTWGALHARCGECRERADLASTQMHLLPRLEPDALQALVEHLHDDHRRVVNLRSEVDLALSGSRGSRVYSHARSRYPSSSFPTRPSTLI